MRAPDAPATRICERIAHAVAAAPPARMSSGGRKMRTKACVAPAAATPAAMPAPQRRNAPREGSERPAAASAPRHIAYPQSTDAVEAIASNGRRSCDWASAPARANSIPTRANPAHRHGTTHETGAVRLKTTATSDARAMTVPSAMKSPVAAATEFAYSTNTSERAPARISSPPRVSVNLGMHCSDATVSREVGADGSFPRGIRLAAAADRDRRHVGDAPADPRCDDRERRTADDPREPRRELRR